MRKSLLLIGIPVALAGAALAIVVGKLSVGATSNNKFADDLQQAQSAGLELAQSQSARKYALTEIAPVSKPLRSKTLKLGAGSNVMRSKAPTVRAAPDPAPTEAVATVPDPAPIAPQPLPEPVAVPAPVVVPQPEPGPILAGGTGRGTGRTGDGTGGTVGTGTSVIGSILGAILRGGVVGGDDTCDPRSTRGTGRRHGSYPSSGYPPTSIGTGRIFPGSR
jgi:hypothetical protein